MAPRRAGHGTDAGEPGCFTDAAERHGLPAVASGPLAPSGGQARPGGLGDAGFAGTAHRAALGRGADPGGPYHRRGRLAAGDAGRGDVPAGIAAADAAKDRVPAVLAPGIFGIVFV